MYIRSDLMSPALSAVSIVCSPQVLMSFLSCSKYKICWTSGIPIALTMPWPFHNSQTSCEVEDINSISTVARFSLALPTTALSHDGPPTRIADTMAVSIPNGAMAKITCSIQYTCCSPASAQFRDIRQTYVGRGTQLDWLINCFATCSPKSANNLDDAVRVITALENIFAIHITYGARSENKLLEKSSPGSWVAPSSGAAKAAGIIIRIRADRFIIKLPAIELLFCYCELDI